MASLKNSSLPLSGRVLAVISHEERKMDKSGANKASTRRRFIVSFPGMPDSRCEYNVETIHYHAGKVERMIGDGAEAGIPKQLTLRDLQLPLARLGQEEVGDVVPGGEGEATGRGLRRWCRAEQKTVRNAGCPRHAPILLGIVADGEQTLGRNPQPGQRPPPHAGGGFLAEQVITIRVPPARASSQENKKIFPVDLPLPRSKTSVERSVPRPCLPVCLSVCHVLPKPRSTRLPSRGVRPCLSYFQARPSSMKLHFYNLYKILDVTKQ